ncbi:MAG: hypothetical protein ABWW65_03245 [Thermoprotei archaeon]
MSKPSSTKSKEIKIITKHVVTLQDIEKDLRKIKLLYIMSEFGEISEKALQYLLYEMKNKGYDLGYNFTVVGRVPTSKELFNDLIALKYTGLVETNAIRKLVISSLGREFLEKHSSKISDEEKNNIKNLIEELRVKVKPIDVEVEMMFKRGRRRKLV